MTASLHPIAPHHLPAFISAPEQADYLMVATAAFLVAAVLAVGLIFFRLHTLPERMAHKKLQFEVVAVLGLLSLFTHIHLFWVAGLLLALIDLPDFSGMFGRMAGSLEKLAGIAPGRGGELGPNVAAPSAMPHPVPPAEPDEDRAAQPKELTHA